MALFVCFCGFPNLPFQKQDFSCSGGPKWDPPVTFERKVREQNQLGFWNISIRSTSAASFIKIGQPTFSTSGTLSQTMTLKQPLQLKRSLLLRTRHTGTQQIVIADRLLLIRTSICIDVFAECHQKLLDIVHREEEKVNGILSAKVVFLNSGKGPKDRYKLPATQHFTPFQKGRQKMAREPREPGS